MTSERDDHALLDMLIASRKATRLAAGLTQEEFSQNEAVHVAAVHFIQILGEAARKVSTERRSRIPAIPWDKIVGMRHRLVHDYFNVRLPIVWDVIDNELPKLIATLETVVPTEEDAS